MVRAMGKETKQGRGKGGAAAKPPAPSAAQAGWGARLRRAVWRGLAGALVLAVVLVGLVRVITPPTTHTIWAEARRLGSVAHAPVALEAVAPVARRAIVAAEDANFCTHWGFDMAAIRAAIAAGGSYGASTLSQQTVKNVFLWQGRSWPRKALEALITPLAEALWPKRRILELYLNVAEFGEGVFGIEAAAQHHFGVPAAALSADQAARLAVILPAPRARNPADLPGWLRTRAAQVADGAETIRRDGRAACFDG